MTARITLIGVAVAAAILTAPTVHADPDPAPSPGPIYSVPGGVLGTQPLPAICGEFPQLCGLDYNPATGSWVPRVGAAQ
jgi:hypothetical protein